MQRWPFDSPSLAQTLVEETRALGEALLDGDLLEGRFLTARVAEAARENDLTAVAASAHRLTERLSPPSGPPGDGVVGASAALSAALFAAVRALESHRASS